MTGSHADLTAAEVRQRTKHPIVDCDGHMLEHLPVFLEFLKEAAGPDMVKRYLQATREGKNGSWYDMSPSERKDHRIGRPPFWGIPAANTLDRATVMLPALLSERLDKLGFDFGIMYPTMGFFLFDEPEAELRQALCRAQNNMVVELFGPFARQMTPAATIPTGTPEEGIAELEHVVNNLGLKAVMVASLVQRPIAAAQDLNNSGNHAYWIDNLALDSAYDYDPFWAKCMELGVAPTAHSFMQGLGARRSVTNYMYNQIGHFADAGEAFAKALFFGGVTRRFPDLHFGVLEGGVGWAASLYCSLVEIWGKRSGDAIQSLNPANLDMDALSKYFKDYGGERFARAMAAVDDLGFPVMAADGTARQADLDLFDDFAAAGINQASDIESRFADPLFFGCEADDTLTQIAFSGKGLPFGTRLKAVLGSDIGHWDVPHMDAVLGEAYELVEDELITEDDFEDFTFTNAVRLHGGMNPSFFEGTTVEEQARAVLARPN